MILLKKIYPIEKLLNGITLIKIIANITWTLSYMCVYICICAFVFEFPCVCASNIYIYIYKIISYHFQKKKKNSENALIIITSLYSEVLPKN